VHDFDPHTPSIARVYDYFLGRMGLPDHALHHERDVRQLATGSNLVIGALYYVALFNNGGTAPKLSGIAALLPEHTAGQAAGGTAPYGFATNATSPGTTPPAVGGHDLLCRCRVGQHVQPGPNQRRGGREWLQHRHRAHRPGKDDLRSNAVRKLHWGHHDYLPIAVCVELLVVGGHDALRLVGAPGPFGAGA
jgi:hypothetical protein